MRACPVCQSQLHPQVRDGVAVDFCAEHGLWLGQRELLAIAEARS